jgi:hypothetical protein
MGNVYRDKGRYHEGRPNFLREMMRGKEKNAILVKKRPAANASDKPRPVYA